MESEEEIYEQSVRNAMEKINSMSVYELLDYDFMNMNTDYDSLDEMVALAGTNDFNSPEWNDFICQYTNFLCWREMLKEARDYMFNRLL